MADPAVFGTLLVPQNSLDHGVYAACSSAEDSGSGLLVRRHSSRFSGYPDFCVLECNEIQLFKVADCARIGGLEVRNDWHVWRHLSIESSAEEF